MTIHVREFAPTGQPRGTVLCLHGFPETSYMWRGLLPQLADAGWSALAPDFPGYGDSPSQGDGSWEAQVAALDRLVRERSLSQVVLVVHDWGGLIGLRWALANPELISALVISDTGYFADGRWHDFAQVLRTPGEGEAFIEQWNRTMLSQILSSVSTGISDDAVGQYARALETAEGRQGILELYRSGDFDKIEAGALAELTVPALVLWGETDPFAPIGGAHRFVRELGGDVELEVVQGAGHFVYEDAPAECATAILGFLDRRFPQ